MELMNKRDALLLIPEYTRDYGYNGPEDITDFIDTVIEAFNLLGCTVATNKVSVEDADSLPDGAMFMHHTTDYHDEQSWYRYNSSVILELNDIFYIFTRSLST